MRTGNPSFRNALTILRSMESETYETFKQSQCVSSVGAGFSGEATPTIQSCYANFSVFMDYKRESISKEMNNDNDLNLHRMTKLSSWLRYWWVFFGVGVLFVASC